MLIYLHNYSTQTGWQSVRPKFLSPWYRSPRMPIADRSCLYIVLAWHVEAENLDWRLFLVSEQSLIKWFWKSCPILELALHLNLTRPCQPPYLHQLFTDNIILTPDNHKTCISYVLSTANRTNMQCVAAICNAFENYPAAYIWDFSILNR